MPERGTNKASVKKVMTCILIVLACLFLLTACFLALHQRTVIMNFRLPEIDIGSTKIPGTESITTTDPADSSGGTGGSVTYQDQVYISLDNRAISLMFQNPENSGSDMVLHFLVDDQEIATTGRIREGYEISNVPLLDNASIKVGTHEGTIVADHFNPKTGEKAIFRLSIDVDYYVS